MRKAELDVARFFQSLALLVAEADIECRWRRRIRLRARVGIAYLMRAEIQPLIDAGRLVRVLEDWSPTYPGFYLYYPSRRQTPPALRALVEFLRQPA